MTMRLALCVMLLALGANAYSDNHDNGADTFDLRAISCEELTTMSEEEQGYVIVMIFGYQAGQSEQPLQTAATIERRITAAYETCAAQPEMTVLDAMVAVASGSRP